MAEKREETQELTLEEQFQALDNIVNKLEREEVTLEESFQLYHQGMTLLKKCNETIDTVEKKVLMLDEDGKTYEF